MAVQAITCDFRSLSSPAINKPAAANCITRLSDHDTDRRPLNIHTGAPHFVTTSRKEEEATEKRKGERKRKTDT
jgi:hypothetical protein